MAEVTRFLHRFLASLAIEAGLSDFFRVCDTLDKDDREEKARKFADSLDEVRHTEGYGISCPHRASRFLTM